MNEIRNHPDSSRHEAAFSLVETLVVVALAAMILVAVLGVFNRVRSDAAAITGKLDENRLPYEILQRIAEDIDRIVAPGFDATVQFRNKVDNGFYSAQLIIENKYYGGQPPQSRIYERVIWVSTYDAFENALLLYRLHDGLNVEDKVLDENKKPEEQTLYIPITTGLTFFEIQAVENQNLISSWVQDKLPRGIQIGISIAPLEEDADGRWTVPEETIIYRTVTVDRTREIPYKFKAKVFDANDFLSEEDQWEEDIEDPNEPLEEEGGHPSEVDPER